jgi:hypothetical protein
MLLLFRYDICVVCIWEVTTLDDRCLVVTKRIEGKINKTIFSNSQKTYQSVVALATNLAMS